MTPTTKWTGSVGNSMDDPTPVYVILEGAFGSRDEAPFGIQFVRVPYDAEAELVIAAELGMPEWDGYMAELRHGVYRKEYASGLPPAYHRRPGT